MSVGFKRKRSFWLRAAAWFACGNWAQRYFIFCDGELRHKICPMPLAGAGSLRPHSQTEKFVVTNCCIKVTQQRCNAPNSHAKQGIGVISRIPAMPAWKRRATCCLAALPPRATLHFVLRDGFDAVEEDVRETLQGEAEGDAGQVIPHEQVTAEISAMIGRSAARRGKKLLEWVVSARAALTLTMDKIHREDALTAVLVAQRIEISLATVQSFPFISTPVKGTRSRS